MLVNFKFKNFLSFADECNFTMSANKDNSHSDSLIRFKDERFSKSRIIYGANASGKTSFIRAMGFVLSYIRKSNSLSSNSKIGVIPFKFRENAYDIPSEFFISFVKNDIKYSYSFCCTRTKVISEKLDVYYSSKSSNIFERKNTIEYKFTKDERRLKDLKEKNLDNKLFLVTAESWNYELAKPVVDFLTEDIIVCYDIEETWKPHLDEILENGEENDYKEFCLKILNSADFSINDFSIDAKKIIEIDKEENPIVEIARTLSKGDEELFNRMVNGKIYNFDIYHDIASGQLTKRYRLDMTEESLGTMQMLMLAPLLYRVFKDGKILVIDEIDRSLHPLLVEYIVKLFLDENLNKNNAQLIANTHDTNLLDLEIFRRDDIWFAERNVKTGSTELFSLSEFSPRNNENIEKSYLLGRFGAIPFIKE